MSEVPLIALKMGPDNSRGQNRRIMCIQSNCGIQGETDISLYQEIK